MKSALKLLAGLFNAIACGVLLPLILLKGFFKLRSSSVVMIVQEGGFGHTIHGPDLARKLYNGQRVSVVILSEHLRHNRQIASIWPDLYMTFLPLGLGLSLGGRKITLPQLGWVKMGFSRYTFALVRLITRSSTRILELHEVYREAEKSGQLAHPEVLKLGPSYRWQAYYFKLSESVKSPRLSLSRSTLEQIDKKVRARARDSNSKPLATSYKLCTLYLRKRGATHDVTSLQRDGSSLEAYLPAVRALHQAGYISLLTGDVPLSPEVARSLGHCLLDAAALGLPEDLYNVFASTQADIFIGEAGGGANLPGLNRIPRLLVNSFPFYYGLPNSWMYFKRVHDSLGKRVHFQDLFSKHAYDYELKGMTIEPNTADEILAATVSFIEDVKKPYEEAPSPRLREIESQIPPHTWIKHSKAHLSPAYVALFDGQNPKL